MFVDFMDELSWRFPYIARDVESYEDTALGEKLLHMKDGSKILYDEFHKTIRTLPASSSGMDESAYRREFGFRLRSVMYRKGVTQDELCRRTGISQQQISKYTKGMTTPSFYTVDKIARALDCNIDELRYID